MSSPGSNMNNGGGLSRSGGLNMWPSTSSYSVQQPQQPQQYEIPKGMSSVSKELPRVNQHTH